jgi:hypothetical protein
MTRSGGLQATGKRRRFGKRRSLGERSALDLDPSSFANLLRQGYGGREATAETRPTRNGGLSTAEETTAVWKPPLLGKRISA